MSHTPRTKELSSASWCRSMMPPEVWNVNYRARRGIHRKCEAVSRVYSGAGFTQPSPDEDRKTAFEIERPQARVTSSEIFWHPLAQFCILLSM